MTSTQTRAHGVSLPLFAIMQRLEDEPLEKLASGLNEGISQLYLDDHLRLVVLVQDGEIGIDLEPHTDYGRAVLKELESRSVIISCPPGECDYDGGDVCIWCGESKKA